MNIGSYWNLSVCLVLVKCTCDKRDVEWWPFSTEVLLKVALQTLAWVEIWVCVEDTLHSGEKSNKCNHALVWVEIRVYVEDTLRGGEKSNKCITHPGMSGNKSVCWGHIARWRKVKSQINASTPWHEWELWVCVPFHKWGFPLLAGLHRSWV